MGFSPKYCDRMCPTPVSEASTSTRNGFVGPGCFKMGAVVNAVFSCWRAASARGFQARCFVPFLTRFVIGRAIEVKP